MDSAGRKDRRRCYRCCDLGGRQAISPFSLKFSIVTLKSLGNRTATAKDASENFLTAVILIFLMRNNFGIHLGDIIRIVFAVIIVMLVYSFLRFLFSIAQTIIVVILIYIVYKIIKAIL